MEKDPFPFARAALVRVFRAPLISRGLKVEKAVKRVMRPASDILVRSGRAGRAFVMGITLGLGLADILLLCDILCVPERVIELLREGLTLFVPSELLDPVCLAVLDPFTEVRGVADGATVGDTDAEPDADSDADPDPETDPEEETDPVPDPEEETDPVPDPDEETEPVPEPDEETDPVPEAEEDGDPLADPEEDPLAVVL